MLRSVEKLRHVARIWESSRTTPPVFQITHVRIRSSKSGRYLPQHGHYPLPIAPVAGQPSGNFKREEEQ
jgi:hypothetical protein